MFKKTRQKKAIMDVLKSTRSHPTADWIYKQVQSDIPNISLGTVYRNLKMMRDNGEISELFVKDGVGRFDARTDNHYHFICKLCGNIQDINGPVICGLESEMKVKTGLNIFYHRLEFIGLCADCEVSKLY